MIFNILIDLIFPNLVEYSSANFSISSSDVKTDVLCLRQTPKTLSGRQEIDSTGLYQDKKLNFLTFDFIVAKV